MEVLKARIKDHDSICKIAKESKYTRDFSNRIFSGENCYKEGRIRKAVLGRRIVGFSCFRFRKRDKVFVLYFLGVKESEQDGGIGSTLLEDLEELAGDHPVEFKVDESNEKAIRFYRGRGYAEIGRKDKYLIYRKS